MIIVKTFDRFYIVYIINPILRYKQCKIISLSPFFYFDFIYDMDRNKVEIKFGYNRLHDTFAMVTYDVRSGDSLSLSRKRFYRD